MISYLEGRLAAKSPTHFIVDVGGVGLYVHIPLSSYDTAQEIGETIRVLTHLNVREDAMTLYGFMTEAERDLFEMLISVSGIGPPMAQQILSGVSIVDFQRLVLAEDVKGLTRIKRIGQKLAQRLVLELKDRVGAVVPEGVEEVVEEGALGQLDEATAALIGLGANPLQARKVVTRVIQEDGDGMAVEEVIRLALKRI
jgi:Holliday junction DNA helicase RuvA